MTDLQDAFREAARREFAMVPDESELHHVFSRRFERKMRRIIRAQTYGYWKMVNTAAKRVAVAAAIIMMLLTSVMAIKPVRERVIKFFVEVYEEYFEITFGEEKRGDLYTPPEPMMRYTLSWLPDGYYEAKHIEADALLFTIWENNGRKDISLYQGAGTHRITLDYNNTLVKIKHGELVISHQSNNETDEYVWEQNDYIFHLTVFKNISFNDALRMIDSIKIADN